MSRILENGPVDINGSAPSNIAYKGYPNHERRNISQEERNYNLTPIKDNINNSVVSRYQNDRH